MKSKELREKRLRIVEEAREILNKAETEGRPTLNGEEEERWKRAMADADELKKQIDIIEKQEEHERELAASQGVRAGRQDTRPQNGGDPEKDKRVHEEGFGVYLRQGWGGLTEEQREVHHRRWMELPHEIRALAAGVDTAGGFTIPEGFIARIETAMKDFSGMRQSRATILRTASGNPLPWPTSDDTGNIGELLAENVGAGEQDVVFGQIVFDAFKYSSKLVRVSRELLQDTGVNLEAWLADKLGVRIGRITNQHLTTGTGTGQPNGVVTASTLGKTGLVGQTLTVIYDDLVDLQHSVDPAYRPRAQWMMHDDSIKVIKLLKDLDGRPLWAPGIAVREPDTILGFPFVVNQDMPVMAANAKSILFGAFEKYMIRDVLNIVLLRLVERYAELFQIGFVAFSRHDGDLLDAGTNPIKHYANSAT